MQGNTLSSGHQSGTVRHAKIAIAGITYIRKSRYRSGVIMQYVCPRAFDQSRTKGHSRFGQTLDVDDYVEEFLNGAPKTAVKKMTSEIEKRLRLVTPNAKDWLVLPKRPVTFSHECRRKSYNAAQMAKELLFEDVNQIKRDQYRNLLQRFVSPLAYRTIISNAAQLDRSLRRYRRQSSSRSTVEYTERAT